MSSRAYPGTEVEDEEGPAPAPAPWWPGLILPETPDAAYVLEGNAVPGDGPAPAPGDAYGRDEDIGYGLRGRERRERLCVVDETF
jgi:hypothetical protein